MATFKFGRYIDIHWNGYDITGPADTVFSIPDQLYEEFNADIAPVEPTLTWIDTNEFGTLSLLNNKVYYQASQPSSPSLTVGDLWVDSDAPVSSSVGPTVVATSPISAVLNTTANTLTLSILPSSTTNSGSVTLTDSVSSTSTSTAATPNSVKTAYDLANTANTSAASKVASITGTLPISVGGTTSATISIASAGTATVGAVQLTDSTSTTSSTLAATATAVKAAKDAADAKVATVSGTAPITTSGTTAITVAVSAGSTSAAGVLQLTDSISSTSTTTAATPNSVKTAYDLANTAVQRDVYSAVNYGSSTVIGTLPLVMNGAAITSAVSGVIYHNRLIPHRNFTVSNIAFVSGTAATTATLIRFGIYTRSGTTFTLVARTASDTTIFAANNTKYTRALATAGGYPATYDLTAGTEYWVSVIQVATTPATILTLGARSAAANAATGASFYSQTGQTDLVASSTGSSATNSALYGEVS